MTALKSFVCCIWKMKMALAASVCIGDVCNQSNDALLMVKKLSFFNALDRRHNTQSDFPLHRLELYPFGETFI